MDSKGEKAMRRASREYMFLCLTIGTVVGMSLVGMGCSTHVPPVELDQARMAYTQAQADPQVSTQAPVALREAEEAVRRAEQTWDKEKDVREVQNLAAVAQQRVELARAAAAQKQAEVDAEQLGAERERVLLEARTREAQRAQEAAEQAQREADRAYQQARSATTRTSLLEQELTTVRQEAAAQEQATREQAAKAQAKPSHCKRGTRCHSKK